jgi:hypothetical protein
MTVAPGTLPPGGRTEVCLSALSGWAVAPPTTLQGGVDFLIRAAEVGSAHADRIEPGSFRGYQARSAEGVNDEGGGGHGPRCVGAVPRESHQAGRDRGIHSAAASRFHRKG